MESKNGRSHNSSQVLPKILPMTLERPMECRHRRDDYINLDLFNIMSYSRFVKLTFEEQLKQHQLSVTSARLAILEVIGKHPHASAENIWEHAKEKIGTISKQAVYDNLHALSERGIIRVIQPMGHAALYEGRVADNHHHIVCRNCGTTHDVDCVEGVATLHGARKFSRILNR